MKTTAKDLDWALRALARTIDYPLVDDYPVGNPIGKPIPANALYITGSNPDGRWRGDVITWAGVHPLGDRLSTRGELLTRIQSATKLVEFTKTHYGLR